MQSIIRHNHSEMNEFSGLLRIIIYSALDCMPSLGMITINVFACADSILIPVQAAYLPVKGLEQLIKTIGKVKRQLNPKLEIEGILLTMVDIRTNYARDISALLIENYGSKVRIFENSIPISVRAAEISAEGVSIYRHDPKGKVASAYQSLTREVITSARSKELAFCVAKRGGERDE